MTKTLLQIASIVAVDVGVAVPTVVAAATDATDRTMLEMKQVIDLTGEEAARRCDWASLRSSTLVTGTGSAVALALPAAYDRMTQGLSISITGSTAIVRGGLSPEEFRALPAVSAGTPRVYLVAGPPGAKTIEFWPQLANAATATVYFQSALWTTSGPGTTYATDSDTAYLPDQVMIKGSIARWRRQKGMDYQDYQAEYEMVLQNYAMFDDNARTP